MATNSDLLKRAIGAVTIRQVLEKFGRAADIPSRDGTKFCSLLRPDKHPSCSIEGGRYHDWSHGLHLDSYDLFQMLADLDSKTAFVPFVQLSPFAHELSLNGNGNAHRGNTQTSKFDWSELVKNVTDQDVEDLSESRGYSTEFSRWLVDSGYIGRKDQNWAFPVSSGGEVVAAHIRRDKHAWRYEPKLTDLGLRVTPLIVGDLATAERIVVAESQWDVFAVLDALGVYSGRRLAGVSTRGAANGELVTVVSATASELILIPQNDSAGQDWLAKAKANIKVAFKVITIPGEYSDANAWHLDCGDLSGAIEEAPIEQPERSADLQSDGQIVKELQIYYDASTKDFWATNDRAGWIKIRSVDVRRWLAQRGFRIKAKDDENVSQVDSLLTAIQRTNDVDYAGPLAGYRAGVYMINSARILVKDSPILIQPKLGAWPLLTGIIENMLGSEQQEFLFGWLKVALEALASAKFRVGQALTLAGPKDCGKSLLQELITVMLGGRATKPHRYMSGATPFNADLFGSEHLVVEDEEPSIDIRSRRNFGTKIKEITANQTHSCHAKHRTALSLTPFWRVSISVNDEPENLMILPPVDESLTDKLIILKAARHSMPMPTTTDEERAFFMDALKSELPHFVHFLFNWKIPDRLISQRYGIAHYQHPEILTALGTLAPETRLLELIDAELFGSVAAGSWQGTASELERKLAADNSTVRREAGKLFSFPTACGTYLGRLQKLYPQRFESIHSRIGNRWTIDPPSTVNP